MYMKGIVFMVGSWLRDPIIYLYIYIYICIFIYINIYDLTLFSRTVSMPSNMVQHGQHGRTQTSRVVHDHDTDRSGDGATAACDAADDRGATFYTEAGCARSSRLTAQLFA